MRRTGRTPIESNAAEVHIQPFRPFGPLYTEGKNYQGEISMYRIIRGGFETKHPSYFIRSELGGITNYLMLIIHSAGHFNIGGKIYQINPGHALILSPGTPYRYGNPNGAYIDDWLHFQVDLPDDFPSVFPMLNEPFPLTDSKFFTTFIRQILWEAAYSKPPYKKANIDSLFTVLINHLLVSYENKDSAASGISSYESQLQSLRLDMKNTLSENHNIKDYASNIGVSESYFQHLYTNYFGISFQKDLIQLRIEQAQYLLSTTNMTVEEIAQRCGYTNDIHFYRQFKQVVHITPGQYRKYGPSAL